MKQFKFPERSELIFLGRDGDELLVTQSGVATMRVHHWERGLPVLDDGLMGHTVMESGRSIDEMLCLLKNVHQEEQDLHKQLKRVLEEKAQYLIALENLGIHITDKFYEDS